MKRIASFLLMLLLLAAPAAAAEVESGEVYCFTAGDFSEEELAGICVTGVPANGTVLLGDRTIRAGDILTAEQAGQMTFAPAATEVDQESVMTYLPIYADRVDTARDMTIAVLGKQDLAPVAEDSALETYKNLANTGSLKAYDPEGDTLTYTVTRNPKRGELAVNADGSYTYTPKKNKVGTDSFAYTVTDSAGNVSREATVTIHIIKPTVKTTYADTVGLDCRFAAEWMRNTGLFVGETIGNSSCFCPEATVTRGEFVTMLVQTLNLPVDADAAYTGFSDQTPQWLRPYLAAAMRAGLTAGWDGSAFDAHTPITGKEAALLIQNALDLAVSAAAMEADNVALAVLAENGVELSLQAMNRAQVAVALYRVSKLAKDAPGMQTVTRR